MSDNALTDYRETDLDPRIAELSSLAAATDASSLDLISPISGKSFAAMPLSSAADIDRAFEMAGSAQRLWKTVHLRERIRCAERLAHVVDARRGLIMDVIQLETGKTRRDALEEVLDVIVTAAYYASTAESALAPDRHRGAVPGLTRAESRRHPYGTVGMICPWNYPFTLFPSDAVPALLAGNAIVAKPSELTPLTALIGRLVLLEAGFPENLIQVVIGDREAGEAVIDRADFIQFTGSTTTGRQVAARTGNRLIPCSLELGGKNPMFVRHDADIEMAVAGAVKGCFANAGQLCVSFERVFVQREIYRAFKSSFASRASGLRLGAGRSFDDDMGSLISSEHMQKIREHVEDALMKGARLAAGGHTHPEAGPFFYAPTILEDVPPEAYIATTETFGPVVSLAPFDTDDDLIRLANELPYGLHASVWTRDLARGNELARRMNFGTVAVNDAYLGTWGSTDMPMGGAGESGIGRRHGREGILKYTESRGVVTQRVHPLAAPHGVPGGWIAHALSRFALLRRAIGS